MTVASLRKQHSAWEKARRELNALVGQSQTNDNTAGSKCEADLQKLVERCTGLDDALLEHEKKYLQKQSYTDSEIERIAEVVKDLKDAMEKGREKASALRAWFRLT